MHACSNDAQSIAKHIDEYARFDTKLVRSTRLLHKNKERAAVCNVLAPVFQPEPASRAISITRVWRFLARCLEMMTVPKFSDQFHANIFRKKAKRQKLPSDDNLELTFGLVIVQVKDCRQCFSIAELQLPSLEICR